MKHLIDAKAFLNVLPFVSKDTTAYSIQAVQIRGNRIWATNGHMAIGHKLTQMDTHNLPDGYSPIDMATTFIITAQDMKRLTGFIKAIIKDAPRGTDAYMAYDTETGVLSDVKGSMTHTVGLYDGEFPDLSKIIPAQDKITPVSGLQVSGGYIGMLGALVGKTPDRQGLQIYSTGGVRDVMIVSPIGDTGWIAFVMPVMGDKDALDATKDELEDVLADLKGEAKPTRLSDEEKQALNARACFDTLKNQALSDHADRLERGVCPVASRARAMKDLEVANDALTQKGLDSAGLDALVQPAALCDTSCPFIKGNEDIACERFGRDCDTEVYGAVIDAYAALNAADEDEDEDLTWDEMRMRFGLAALALHDDETETETEQDKVSLGAIPPQQVIKELAVVNALLAQDVYVEDEDDLPPAVTQTDLTDGELALVEYALTPYEGD